MKTIKQYLEEAAVNSHMEHLPDLVFLGGVNGTRKAINFMRDVRDMLRNDGARQGGVTIKFDGAPQIISGIDPTDGKFFVAKKGVFNKNPKVYKTQADIDADLQGELHAKFSLLLPELAKLGIKGIIQGDLMYTKDDLTTQVIDGAQMITFHPNTILYAVPVDSDLGERIKKSKVGIVFHTKYTGTSFADMSASFGEALTTSLKRVDSVWAADATYEDQTGRANFTPAESANFDKKLTSIGKLFASTKSDIINHINKDDELRSLVLIYINSRVRANKQRESGNKIAAGFVQFITDRYQKEIDAKKSVKGQEAAKIKRNNVLLYLNQIELSELSKVFDLAYDIDEAKNMLISVLNRASALKTFIKTKSGIRVTNQEGFVAINSDGEQIKLVDRLEFQLSNFSPEVIKGFR